MPTFEAMEFESILAKAYQATEVAVNGNIVTMKVPGGVMMARRTEVKECPVVTFEYIDEYTGRRVSNWYNASSVSDLGDYLRTVKRVAKVAIPSSTPMSLCEYCRIESGGLEGEALRKYINRYYGHG